MEKMIPTCRLLEFNKVVANLNKKLAVSGKDLIQTKVSDPFFSMVTFVNHESGSSDKDDEVLEEMVEFVRVDIVCPAVVKKDDQDYRFLGTINYKGGFKTVFVVEKDYASEFVEDVNVCDHCHTNRQRNVYHLFLAGDKVFHLGSSCCKEYFGIDVDKELSLYLKTFITFKAFGDEDESFFHDSLARSWSSVYAATKFFTKDFTSWQKPDRDAEIAGTAQITRKDLFYVPAKESVGRNARGAEIPDFELVKEYWGRQPVSSFQINCFSSLKGDYVLEKNVGTAAYALYQAYRDLAREKAKKETSFDYKSEEEYTFKTTVTKVVSYTDYTYDYRGQWVWTISFECENGAKIATTTTSKAFRDLKEGDKVEMVAIVKKETAREDGRVYIVSRPRMVNKA